MDIAKIIRRGREKMNLNQSQLAKLVGVSPQAVQQWESGATQPRGKRLSKIAEVLKLPPLMHLETTPPHPEHKVEAVVVSYGAVLDKPAKMAADGQSAAKEALIKEAVGAMRLMSKEDITCLVMISKALVAAKSRNEGEEVDLKPLPKPDLAPHPPPAFPARRMPPRVKTR